MNSLNSIQLIETTIVSFFSWFISKPKRPCWQLRSTDLSKSSNLADVNSSTNYIYARTVIGKSNKKQLLPIKHTINGGKKQSNSKLGSNPCELVKETLSNGEIRKRRRGKIKRNHTKQAELYNLKNYMGLGNKKREKLSTCVPWALSFNLGAQATSHKIKSRNKHPFEAFFLQTTKYGELSSR